MKINNDTNNNYFLWNILSAAELMKSSNTLLYAKRYKSLEQ